MNKKEEIIGQDILRPLSFVSSDFNLRKEKEANEEVTLRENTRVRTPQFTIVREDFERVFYDSQEKEAKVWIEEVFKDTPNETQLGTTSDDFKEILKDGVLICKLLQLIDENVMQKYNQSPKTPANCMDNIELFIKGVKQLGIKVSFTSVDLYEKKSMKKVIGCIHELAFLSNKRGKLPEFKTQTATFRNLMAASDDKKAKDDNEEDEINKEENNSIEEVNQQNKEELKIEEKENKEENIENKEENKEEIPKEKEETTIEDKKPIGQRGSSWGDLTLRSSSNPRRTFSTATHRNSRVNLSSTPNTSNPSNSSDINNNNSSNSNDDNNNNNTVNPSLSSETKVEISQMPSIDPLDSLISPRVSSGNELEELKNQLLREREARETLEKQLQQTIVEKEKLEQSMSQPKQRRKRKERKVDNKTMSSSDFRNSKLSSSTSSLMRYSPKSIDHSSSSNFSFLTVSSSAIPNLALEEQKQEKEKRREERKAKEEARRAKLENKNQRQRLCILEEILNTEQDYVEDLRIIVKAQNGLTQDKAIPLQDINTLFSNIQQILSVHEEIYKMLNIRITSTKSEECWNCSVGDIFTKLADFLKVYTTYVSNQNNQNQIADQNLHHNKNFVASLLKNVPEFESKEVATVSFHSYLIKPIQRICKYPLLLKELDRATPIEHEDKPNIEKALSQVQLIAQHINQKKREMETMMKLMEIEHSIADLPRGFKIMASDRTFIREGNLIKVSKGRAQERVFFLFNDLILYAAKPLLMGNLLFKGKIPLNLILINDLPDQSPDRKNIFELVRLDHKKKKYIICAKEPQDKVDWMKDIKLIVDKNLLQSKEKPTLTPLAQLRELTEEIDQLKSNPPVMGDDEEEYNRKVIDYEVLLNNLNSKLASLKKDIFVQNNTSDDTPSDLLR